MHIDIINPVDYQGWDKLLLSNNDYSIFHSSHWAKVLMESYHYEPLYFAIVEDGRVLLSIPMMEINSYLTGKRGISLPFTDYCEPILPKSCTKNEVWDVLVEYGRKKGWKYLEIRGGDGFGRVDQPSSWYYEHTLNLSQELNDIHLNFRDSNKRNIKKAQNEHVEVDLCNSMESIRQFYRLHCMTRRKHGLPPPPFSFFKNLYEYLIAKDQGFLVVAKHYGKVIAAALSLHFGKRAIFKYGASDVRYHNLKPNNLVIWKMIELYWQKGMHSLSFGRTDPKHMGLKQFKDGWRSEEKKINYYRYNFYENSFVNILSPVDSWLTGIFQKTPIPLLKMVGSVLYKHMG